MSLPRSGVLNQPPAPAQDNARTIDSPDIGDAVSPEPVGRTFSFANAAKSGYLDTPSTDSDSGDAGTEGAPPAWLDDVPDDVFGADQAASMQPDDFESDSASSRFSFSGIVEQRGLGETIGADILGIPQAAFSGVSAAVPPGSHYPEWVWNAMDRVGHVTVELYIDARRLEQMQASDDPAARQFKPQYVRREPKCDLASHCLISVPQDGAQTSAAPWGVAQRVLLVPYTTREDRAEPAKEAFGRRIAAKPAQRHPHPIAAAADWLIGDVSLTAAAMLGRCQIAETKQTRTAPGGGVALISEVLLSNEYWVIVSRNDAERLERSVLGENNKADPAQQYGQDGVAPIVSEFIKGENRRVSRVVPVDKRRPIPPARRWLGVWSGPGSEAAMLAAQRRAGPVMSTGWDEADVQILRAEHAGLYPKAAQAAEEPVSPIPDQVTRDSQVLAKEVDAMHEQTADSSTSAEHIPRPRSRYA